jgi:hypothetical protein
MSDLARTLMTVLAAGPPADIWNALTAALKDNPTVAILGLVVASFSTGFAARKYFQDRELDRLKASLKETQQKAEAASKRTHEIESAEKESKERLRRITDCLAPDDLKSTLAEHLRHWPTEKHGLLIVAIMRQLLTTPGSAWLCTPAGTALVKVEWDDKRGACKVSAEMNSQVDPIKDLRGFIKNPQALDAVLFDVAIYGIASVAVETGPSLVQRILVRQGPALSWLVEKQTLQRVKA